MGVWTVCGLAHVLLDPVTQWRVGGNIFALLSLSLSLSPEEKEDNMAPIPWGGRTTLLC